jgi:aspartyl-tRNA(Asn)/glutamyl-tRNA(Gln) amidotransferase subunit A
MTSPDLRRIVDVAPLVKDGTLSPVEIVQRCLTQIDARHALNAFITRRDQAAVDEARALEAELASGTYRGPLHGIPIAVKDLIDVAGTKTTSGSAVPAVEASTDAPVIARLREAGAIIIGKTNLHEFAFGTTSDETAFGAVRNPFDETRSAGGSSGGSAAALATGMAFAALGTDTGGSIRIPSAVCGTVGLKPTYGELSTDGVVALSSTLDHVGPMTRSVADAALLFEVMSGVPPSTIASGKGHYTFGVPKAYFCDKLDPGVAQALDRAVDALKAAGHTVRTVDIAHAAWTADVYLHIVLPEAGWYHAERLERYAASFSPGIRLRIEMGRYILAEDYVRAMQMRDVLTQSVDAALDGIDGLILPSLSIAAPPIGATTVDVGGSMEPVRATMLRLTQLFDITGHPAIALPAPQNVDPLPRGVQIVGHRHRTARLLEIAMAVERHVSGDARDGGL